MMFFPLIPSEIFDLLRLWQETVNAGRAFAETYTCTYVTKRKDVIGLQSDLVSERRIMPKKGGQPDRLEYQIAFKLGIPKGASVSKKVFDELVSLIVRGKKLPRNVEVSAIFWRNPDRVGDRANWRTYRGADTTNAPGPIQSGYPRGSLRDAIDSLANALESGTGDYQQIRSH